MSFLNDACPWSGSRRGARLGIVDLIENATVPVEAAAALWWAVERGASFFVAARAGSAGKTTLADSLFPFLPADARLYAVDGARDPIDLPVPSPPTYLLINELSDHMQRYVSGAAALKAFALLRSGHRMIGTLHADSAVEALLVMQAESGIPVADALQIPLILVLRPLNPANLVGWRPPEGVERRLVEIARVLPSGGVVDIARWNPTSARLETCLAPGGLAALAEWAGVPEETAGLAIRARAGALMDLIRAGDRSAEAIAGAVSARRLDEHTARTD